METSKRIRNYQLVSFGFASGSIQIQTLKGEIIKSIRYECGEFESKLTWMENKLNAMVKKEEAADYEAERAFNHQHPELNP